MTGEKRGGGPKTLQGKARSSANAKTHGLTSKVPSNSQEKVLVETYAKELIDYYDPQSPLEKLQIERIAICRAKLQYLYDLEQIKLTLASKELESQPEKILEKVPGLSTLAMGMAIECIAEGQIYLPCRLDLALLETICQEIEGFNGVIENQHQFARALPKLTKYLNSYPVVGLNNTNQWMEKLVEVVKHLERLSAGERYSGKWRELIEGYLLGKDYEAMLEKEAKQPEIDELERYQEERRIARGQKPREKEPQIQSAKSVMPEEATLHSQLRQFTSLLQTYREAEQAVYKYHEIKELMTKAISLPAAESDLLMRYQTTLERRLSSAIGELLALQRANRQE